ncbi:hypothetical protein XENTR_v10020361 [Xenopus tropicalis]|nr:hypothetical protein XENTR_v10020361 [Xenopus tropicalis]
MGRSTHRAGECCLLRLYFSVARMLEKGAGLPKTRPKLQYSIIRMKLLVVCSIYARPRARALVCLLVLPYINCSARLVMGIP